MQAVKTRQADQKEEKLQARVSVQLRFPGIIKCDKGPRSPWTGSVRASQGQVTLNQVDGYESYDFLLSLCAAAARISKWTALLSFTI